MAVLPDIKPIGAAPNPTLGVARYGGPDESAMEALGLAQAQQGAIIGKAGDEIYAAAKVEKEKNDTLVAEDAYNQLQQKRLDLTYGPGGFTSLKGGDAANKPIIPEYGQKFQEATDQIANTLKDGEQAILFKRRAAVGQLAFNEDLIKHVTTQNNVYAKDVYDGTVKVEQQNVVANWDNPVAVNMSIARVTAATKLLAEKNGLPPEMQQANLLQDLTQIHNDVIQQAIKSGNNTYAEAWYNDHKDQIGLSTAKVLEVAVRDGQQKDLFNGYQSQYLGVQNDPKGLATLLDSITADTKLDQARQNTLIGRVQNQMSTLEVRQDRYMTRVQAVAEKGLTQLENKSLAGYDLTPEEIKPYIDASKGNPILEARVNDVIQTANITSKYRLAGPVGQAQMMTELTSKVRAGGATRATLESVTDAIFNVGEKSGPEAVSPQGATGRAQIMPDTFKQYAKPGESYNVEADRVVAAKRKIADDFQFYGGDATKTAAAYIGGRGAVRADGSIREDVKDALGTTPADYAQRVGQAAMGSRQARFDVQLLAKLQSITDSQNAQIKADPMTFAVRQGIIAPDTPGAASFDTSNPDKMDPAAVQARFGIARGMAKSYETGMKPWTQAEVQLATSTLRNASVDQKSMYFGALAKASGQDFDGYKAVIAQLAPDDPPLAIAGIYAGMGRSVTDFGMDPVAGQPSKVSDLIIAGQAILHPPKKEDGQPPKGSLIPMPPEPKMRPAFDDYVRTAYAGNAQANNAYYQTSQAIYAKLSADAGDKDTTILDTDRWAKAIQLATGGIADYRGQKLPMPYGKDVDQFTEQLNRRINYFVTQGGMPPELSVDQLKNLPLKAVKDGVYVFRAGDGIQGDKFGKPIVMDFNKPIYDFRMEDIPGYRPPGSPAPGPKGIGDYKGAKPGIGVGPSAMQ